MEKNWVPINSFSNYEVHPKHGIRNKKTKKILKGRTWLGYPKVTLMKEGKKHEIKIHRVVAETFIPNKSPKTHWIVNHKDGNRSNFSVTNLEWVTPSGNQIDRWKRAKTGWNIKYRPEYGKYKRIAEDIINKTTNEKK